MAPNRTTVFRYFFAVSAALVFVGIYNQWIAPLKSSEGDLRRNLRELEQSFEGARKTSHRAVEVEHETAYARGELNAFYGDRRKGSALVWLPDLVKEHFTQSGIAVTIVRLNALQDEAELPGYKRAYWGVGLPVESAGKSLSSLLLAVADIEAQNKFLKVLDFTIQPDVTNPLLRTASFNLETLVRK